MYVVVENTPGYMPDSDDQLRTDDWDTAVSHARELAGELEEQGYSCDHTDEDLAVEYYGIYCFKHENDLGRVITVTPVEEETT